MSNNYTQFSEELNFPKEALDYLEDAISSSIEAETENICYGLNALRLAENKLVVYSDESGDIELIADLIQETMEKFNVKGCVVLEWCTYCDKPKAGEFGGGALAISMDEIQGFSTADYRMEHQRIEY